MKLLLIEDEVHLADALCQILKKNNYAVDVVHDGEQGYDYATTGIYDLVVLDIMLPKRNGIDVLKALRKDNNKVPVLLLTAKGEISDRVLGLDCGADDYLPKPFSTEELLARIRALLRRHTDDVADTGLAYGDIVLNRDTASLSCGTSSIKLTLKEYEVMEFLMMRKNMITPKELMIEKLWGFDSDAEDNHVEVYISFLRKKLSHLQAKVKITTSRGIGYALEVDERV